MFASVSRASWDTIDPTTGLVLERFEPMSASEIDAAFDRARSCFEAWRACSFEERARVLRSVAATLRSRSAGLAATMALEMGKPIVQGRAEIEKSARTCEFYAAHGAAMLADERIETEAQATWIAYRPLGVVLAIMPWNFPTWQAIRAIVPALMAGNTVVLKHASNVTRCALEIGRIFAEAGAPTGLLEVVLVPGSEVSNMIGDSRIAAVTLTGSEAAGMSVARVAGANLKKSVLELGGSDAFIVLGDADVARAASVAATARFQNTGQSCIAAKRFIVEDRIHDAFVAQFRAAVAALRIGSPNDESTELGPMARIDLRDELLGVVRDTVAQGARMIIGGEHGPGAFMDPVILVDVLPAMRACAEETFGPVAAVMRARDADHAVALANDSNYGLAGSLWTSPETARRLVPRIESGAVFINAMAASDPRLPFGGIKKSGFGRELGTFGIREFVNVQTCWLA